MTNMLKFNFCRNDTSKDEEIARKLQEELDNELANSIMRNSMEQRPGHAAQASNFLESRFRNVSSSRSSNNLRQPSLTEYASRRNQSPSNTSIYQQRRLPTPPPPFTVHHPSHYSSSSSSSSSSSASNSNREIPGSIQNELLYEMARSRGVSARAPRANGVNLTSSNVTTSNRSASRSRFEDPLRRNNAGNDLAMAFSYFNNLDSV